MDEKMKLVNLTPHEIVVVGEDGKEKARIPPSGEIARIRLKQEFTSTVKGIPIVRTILFEIEGLPEPQPNTLYIVSSLVAQAVPYREDVVVPDRDEEGRIIGLRDFRGGKNDGGEK